MHNRMGLVYDFWRTAFHFDPFKNTSMSFSMGHPVFTSKLSVSLGVFFVRAWWLILLLVSPTAFADLLKDLKGELTQGSMVIGTTTEPGVRVELDGVSVPVSTDGTFVFGFGRDAGSEATLTLTGPEGVQEQHTLKVTPREYNLQYIEGIPQKMMSPDAAALKRIRKENAMVAKARRVQSQRQDFLQKFIWPSKGPISGVYGSQRFYNGEPRRPHFGVDIAAPMGAPVIAPANGKVTLTHDDMFFSGGTLIVDHGYGISSTFIHLSEILVKEGQEVAQGDLIARVGASGRATGPHLDWRMNWNKTRLDPQLLLDGVLPE